MQDKAEYVTRTTKRPQAKRCPGCMSVFGTVVADGTQLATPTLLQHGVVRGFCAKCGHPITWSASDRHIESITRKAKARKDKMSV